MYMIYISFLIFLDHQMENIVSSFTQRKDQVEFAKKNLPRCSHLHLHRRQWASPI